MNAITMAESIHWVAEYYPYMLNADNSEVAEALADLNEENNDGELRQLMHDIFMMGYLEGRKEIQALSHREGKS